MVPLVHLSHIHARSSLHEAGHNCRTRLKRDMPGPEPGHRRHARARAGAGGTCPMQSRAKRDMPEPEPGQRRHARARAGPKETCPSQSRSSGDMPESEPGQRTHALASAGAGGGTPMTRRGRRTRPQNVKMNTKIFSPNLTSGKPHMCQAPRRFRCLGSPKTPA